MKSKENILKKIGWFLVACLPMVAFLTIQVGCVLVAMVLITVLTMTGGTEPMSAELLTVTVTNRTMENIMPILVVSQLISILVFGLWYYFAYGKRKRPETAGKPKPCHILLIFLLGIMAQFAISGVLSLIELLAPQVMQQYEELMEASGLTETTWLTIFSTVLFAPLGEELVCRGLIFKLAGRVSSSFWVANIIQSLAFGILHGNLIQGCYAFALGIVLGLLYRRFQNIWLCMFLHASMNFSSILVGPYYSLFPEKLLIAAFIVTILVTAMLFVLCYRALMKERQLPSEQLAEEQKA